jgi:hypothetical protein
MKVQRIVLERAFNAFSVHTHVHSCVSHAHLTSTWLKSAVVRPTIGKRCTWLPNSTSRARRVPVRDSVSGTQCVGVGNTGLEVIPTFVLAWARDTIAASTDMRPNCLSIAILRATFTSIHGTAESIVIAGNTRAIWLLRGKCRRRCCRRRSREKGQGLKRGVEARHYSETE